MKMARSIVLALGGTALTGVETAQAAGMPQLDSSTFAPQLVWLAISFIVLYLVMTKIALPRVGQVLDDRQARIDGDLKQAREFKASAEKTAEAYETALAEARAQAQQTLRTANQETAAEAGAALGKLAEKLTSNVAQAESRISAARDQALAKIKTVSVEVAQVAAERLMGETVDEAVVKTAVEAELKERG